MQEEIIFLEADYEIIFEKLIGKIIRKNYQERKRLKKFTGEESKRWIY